MNKKMVRTAGIFVTAVVAASGAAGIGAYAAPQITENASQTDAGDLTNEIIEPGNVYVQAVMLYEQLSGTEVEIPAGMSENEDINGFMQKAVTLGLLNLGEVDYKLSEQGMLKQDMVSMLYKVIVRWNPTLDITADEAAVILNDCADNAEIYDENRIAYAFMIKYGVIARYEATEPMKTLTYGGCSSLYEAVYETFAKGMSITVGDNTVYAGDSVQELVGRMGMPTRIDSSEYGFEWYVYNTDYADFVMIGVENGLVKSFYSNAQNFSAAGVSSGDDFSAVESLAPVEGLTFFEQDGKLDAVLYNRSYKQDIDAEELEEPKRRELVDILNAYRVKNGWGAFVTDDMLTGRAEAALAAYTADPAADVGAGVNICEGFDVFQLYAKFLENGGGDLLPQTDALAAVGADISCGADGRITAAFAVDQEKVMHWESIKPMEPAEEVSYAQEIEPMGEAPVVVADIEGQPPQNGQPLLIALEKPVSDVYYVRIFNKETQDYAVNSFITTGSDVITIAPEFFDGGAEYTLELGAVSADGEIPSQQQFDFVYGTAEIGVEILSPEQGLVTDDDFIDLSWQSSAYDNFCISMYNEAGEAVATTFVSGTRSARIEDIDPGKYSICVGAMRNNDATHVAQDWIEVEIQDPVPEVTEIVLERDDVYEFVYEDEEGNVYFYDQDIVKTEEDGQTVYKKKIIQKKIKGTHNYRELAAMQNRIDSTTGVPIISGTATEAGTALVEEAKKYLGIPYLWGGTTTSGFDCSGLMQYVCRQQGISISRTSREQFANDGVFVTKAELQPGDLVFFQKNGVIHHVGMYVGDGMMIHAPRTGENVQIASMETEYYQNSYAGAKRIVG